jgi:hypothetical protein
VKDLQKYRTQLEDRNRLFWTINGGRHWPQRLLIVLDPVTGRDEKKTHLLESHVAS